MLRQCYGCNNTLPFDNAIAANSTQKLPNYFPIATLCQNGNRVEEVKLTSLQHIYFLPHISRVCNIRRCNCCIHHILDLIHYCIFPCHNCHLVMKYPSRSMGQIYFTKHMKLMKCSFIAGI